MRAAPVARLAVAPVHRHALGAAGERRAGRLVEVGPEERAGRLPQRPPGVDVERGDRGQRVHAAGPQHLALVDVAHARGDALVQQQLGRRGRLVAELGDALHALGHVDVRVAQVRPERGPPAGVVGEVLGLEGLDHGGVEAHGLEALDLDDRPHAAGALAPPLARPVQVPRAGHPHVGVEDGAVVPADLDVLPAASTRSITAPMAGRWPFRRGASNPVMTFSSSAARSAVAVRWMVSPSGTAPRLRGGP